MFLQNITNKKVSFVYTILVYIKQIFKENVATLTRACDDKSILLLYAICLKIVFAKYTIYFLPHIIPSQTFTYYDPYAQASQHSLSGEM